MFAALLATAPCSAQTSPAPRATALNSATVARLFASASEQRISHPALLALEHWEELALTPAQVSRMRQIQEELGVAYMVLLNRQLSEPAPDSVWLSEKAIDEAAIRTTLRRQADEDADFTIHLLRLGQEAYRSLSPVQQRTLRTLHQEQASIAQQPAAERTPRLCTSGGAGGGFQVNPRVAVVYSVDFYGDSARLGAVFVGRAREKLYSTPSVPRKPVLPESTGLLSGGTIGSWYMQYDERHHVAWVDTQKVELGPANVVLVDGVEILHQPPTVIATARIPERVFTGGCRGNVEFTDILRNQLESVPEVRAFMGPDESG